MPCVGLFYFNFFVFNFLKDNKDNLLKEIRKQLQLEDVENGDLINTDSDDQQVEKVVREIVAKWDYQRKNYFI